VFFLRLFISRDTPVWVEKTLYNSVDGFVTSLLKAFASLYPRVNNYNFIFSSLKTFSVPYSWPNLLKVLVLFCDPIPRAISPYFFRPSSGNGKEKTAIVETVRGKNWLRNGKEIVLHRRVEIGGRRKKPSGRGAYS
jgi:hypothetical protein